MILYTQGCVKCDVLKKKLEQKDLSFTIESNNFQKIINRLQAEKIYDDIVNADYNRAVAKKQKDSEFAKSVVQGIIKDTVNSAVKWGVNTLGQVGTMMINKHIAKNNKKSDNKNN